MAASDLAEDRQRLLVVVDRSRVLGEGIVTVAQSNQAGRLALAASDLTQDRQRLLEVVDRLVDLGFSLVATSGTAAYLAERGYEVESINKVREGSPHIVDLLGAGKVDLVINTPEGSDPLLDSRSIRLVANELGVPTFTTMAAAAAVTRAIKIVRDKELMSVTALQDYHSGVALEENS